MNHYFPLSAIARIINFNFFNFQTHTWKRFMIYNKKTIKGRFHVHISYDIIEKNILIR